MLAGFSHTSPIILRVAFGEERKQGESEAGTVRKFENRGRVGEWPTPSGKHFTRFVIRPIVQEPDGRFLGSRKYEGDCLAGRQFPHGLRFAMRGDRGQGKTEGETVRKSFRFPEPGGLCHGESCRYSMRTP